MNVGARKRRPDWRRIKKHRSYTVDEAARTLGASKGTVRRWTKSGLPALVDQKPMLILGADLIEFGGGRRKPKCKCAPDECYCVRCRVPRTPFDREAEYVPLNGTGGNLRGLCPICTTLMHKRVSLRQLPAISALLELSFPQGHPSLRDCDKPSPNDH
jgi:hypothetical protein